MNPSTEPDDPWLGLVDSFREVRRPDDPLEPFAHTTMVDVPGFGSCPRSSGIEDSPLADRPAGHAPGRARHRRRP
jgi:hypothetical protein